MLYWGCDGTPFFMDYQIPDLCVRSITPDEETGKMWLDMPSKYDSTPQKPMLVSQEVIDYVMNGKYQVPMCPPGWPNPLTETE